MFIGALFTIAKFWKQPRYPTTDEWIKKMWNAYLPGRGDTMIKKMWYIYIHNGVFFSHKEE
jgi:hypothetical protein